MPAASRARRRTRLFVLAPLLGLALLIAGCSSPGSVNSYTAEVEQNFIRACVEANDKGLSDEEAQRVCRCWFEHIEENMSFDEFKNADERIREGLENGTITHADDLDDAVPGYVEVLNRSGCVGAGPRPS